MPRKRLFAMLALSMVMVLGFAGATGAGPQQFAPYTGVIQNHTQHSLSVPSGNSDGTLIVPPGGWIEYVSWRPAFQLTAYVEGQPFYCQQVQVAPGHYPFKCKAYDFMAEVQPEKGKPAGKKGPAEKETWGGEVEGLG